MAKSRDVKSTDKGSANSGAQDSSAKDSSAKDSSAKDSSAQDSSAKDSSAQDSSAKDSKSSKLKAWLPLLVCVLMIVTLLAWLRFFPTQYFLAAVLLIVESILLWLLYLEKQRPQAREIAVMAALATLGIAGRALFYFVPQVKPTAAIVVVAGLALGSAPGFTVGLLTMFLSNFLFGQSINTPFQMFGMALVGFLAGLFSRDRVGRGRVSSGRVSRGHVGRSRVANRLSSRQSSDSGLGSDLGLGLGSDSGSQLSTQQSSNLSSHKNNPSSLPLPVIALLGFVLVFIVYGLVVDTGSVLFLYNWQGQTAVWSVYLAGIPFNLVHAGSTAVFLVFLSPLLTRQLQRISRKYGLFGW